MYKNSCGSSTSRFLSYDAPLTRNRERGRQNCNFRRTACILQRVEPPLIVVKKRCLYEASDRKRKVTFGWCIAHRLELALKDALTETTFDKLILRLYYVYKRLSKKLRQLKELCEIYEHSQFSESGHHSKKASGTVHFLFSLLYKCTIKMLVFLKRVC